ncbi:MAG TPA: DUF2272 domain-containing protein [Rhizomicrobium sp.]|jgi:hypothetical protein
MTQFRDRTVAAAVGEWTRWGEQIIDQVGNRSFSDPHKKEGLDPWAEVVHGYWKDGTNNDYTGKNDIPWSATFVSWVMRKAGADGRFKANEAHAVYIHWAIRNELDHTPGRFFFGRRVADTILLPGDLIGAPRPHKNSAGKSVPTKMTYDLAAADFQYSSHCDIVVAVDTAAKTVETVGGNVSNAVTKKIWRLNDNGRLYLNPTQVKSETAPFVAIQNTLP